jgi:arylamine N-acetyltransferase
MCRIARIFLLQRLEGSMMDDWILRKAGRYPTEYTVTHPTSSFAEISTTAVQRRTGERRQLHNEQLRAFHYSGDIIRVVKSSRMGGTLSRHRKKIMHEHFSPNSENKRPLERG